MTFSPNKERTLLYLCNDLISCFEEWYVYNQSIKSILGTCTEISISAKLKEKNVYPLSKIAAIKKWVHVFFISN